MKQIPGIWLSASSPDSLLRIPITAYELLAGHHHV